MFPLMGNMFSLEGKITLTDKNMYFHQVGIMLALLGKLVL